mmetsp:Transcript_34438/g.48910  ORF Transcript_34438/g.48910 Transcript_34438/m.48910 type:complete len:98 (+) Transcript_34438:33-326(+)
MHLHYYPYLQAYNKQFYFVLLRNRAPLKKPPTPLSFASLVTSLGTSFLMPTNVLPNPRPLPTTFLIRPPVFEKASPMLTEDFLCRSLQGEMPGRACN